MAGQGLGFTPPTFKSQLYDLCLYDLEQLINYVFWLSHKVVVIGVAPAF